MLARLLVGTVLALGTAGRAAANGDHYDGSVEFGAGTLKDDALARSMRAWVDAAVADARREARELATIARDNDYPVQTLDQDISHKLMFSSSRVISILRTDYEYTGGAHGNTWLIPINWDVEQQALIPIEALFGEPEGNADAYGRVADILAGHLVTDVWGSGASPWIATIDEVIRPDPTYLSVFTFVPSTVPGKIGGIAWHFEPYSVAPGSEGPVTVIVPQDELRALIEPGIRAMFAGEPQGDTATLGSYRAIR